MSTLLQADITDLRAKRRNCFGCLIAYSEKVALLLPHVNLANGSRWARQRTRRSSQANDPLKTG